MRVGGPGLASGGLSGVGGSRYGALEALLARLLSGITPAMINDLIAEFAARKLDPASAVKVLLARFDGG